MSSRCLQKAFSEMRYGDVIELLNDGIIPNTEFLNNFISWYNCYHIQMPIDDSINAKTKKTILLLNNLTIIMNVLEKKNLIK